MTDLSDDLRIRVEVNEPPRELRGRGMVVRFGEDVDSASKRNLQVRRLQLTVSEVRSQLQASLDVVRIFLGNAATLQFYGDTEEVFARRSHGFSPLRAIVIRNNQVKSANTQLTSRASSSDDMGTNNREYSAARNATCASASLLADTNRKPSANSARTDASDRTATGKTLLVADSWGSLLI
jgi:hypothetical protein